MQKTIQILLSLSLLFSHVAYAETNTDVRYKNGEAALERAMKGDDAAIQTGIEEFSAVIAALKGPRDAKTITEAQTKQMAAAYESRGALQDMRDFFGSAAEDFSEALAIRPSGELYNKLARTTYLAEEYDLALEAANKGIALDPENPYLYNTRASIYTKMGDTEAAINNLEIALLKGKDNPEIKEEAESIGRELRTILTEGSIPAPVQT